jgi:hypothetical protein
MNQQAHLLMILMGLGSVMPFLLISSATTQALIRSGNHRHRHIRPDYTRAYYETDKESYIKNTLPDERVLS